MSKSCATTAEPSNYVEEAEWKTQARPVDLEDPPHIGEKQPLLAGSAKAVTHDPAFDDALLAPTVDGQPRYPHLDMWRAVCIAVVVLDHGNWHYSEWNLLFGQNWTLQFIFCICGISFGLSRMNIGGYILRLSGYVALGVTFNVVANSIVKVKWWNNPWDVVFQFWFVVALIGYSLLLLPMKWFLVRCRDQGSRTEASGAAYVLKGLLVVGLGLVALFLIMSKFLAGLLNGALGDELAAFINNIGPGLSYWAGDPAKVLVSLVSAFELSLSNIWLAVSVPLMFPSQQALTGWAILANMHCRRLCLQYSGVGEKLMNGLDLMLLGLVCYFLGFKFRRPIGDKMARYWFVWISVCGLVWKPGTHGRLDLLMPEEWHLRWRMQFIDSVFMLMFLTAGDRTFDPKIFTEDKCYFINKLGLFLFLVHKAIHILFPEPWNWLVILSWVPVFWSVYRYSSSSKI